MAVLIAPVVAAATGLAVTSTIVGIISTVIALGLSMAIASAFKPNLGEFGIDGQGQVLDTRKSNTNAVAIVYGENKLAGNIIWQTTNNYNGGDTNKDYWAIISISDGAANDFIELYSDEYLMDSSTEDIHTLEYQHIHTHDTSGAGKNVTDVTFVTNDSGNTELGSSIFGALVLTTSSNNTDSINLTDGDLDTYWSPDTDEDEWILFINNNESAVSSVSMYLGASNADEYSIKLQYSDNNSTWNDGSDLYERSDGDERWQTISSTEAGSHTYWRIYFDIIEFRGNPSKIYELDIDSDSVMSVTIPSDISYMAVHHEYDVSNNPTIQNITAVMEGREIDVFDTVSTTPLTTEYSNYAPDIVFDIMKESLNVNIDDVNQESFYNARVHAIANDLTCNIPFIEKQNTDSAIQAALATIRGHLSFSNNEWIFIYDAPQSSIKSLTEDDIIENTLNVAAKPSSDTANTITVRYVNPSDMWQVAEITVEDEDMIDSDGQVIEQIVEIRGCTSSTQARKLAQLTLNQMRYSEDSGGDRVSRSPVDISFVTSVKNSELEVGDVINITHYLLGYPRDFKIVSIETDQSGAISINGVEYCDTHYKNDDDTDIIT